MRMKTAHQPYLMFNLDKPRKSVLEEHRKYDFISVLLDDTPRLLNLFHHDLQEFDEEEGRDSGYSSEQVLRALVVLTLEGMSYRSCVMRLHSDIFLRNFVRLGIGPVMDFSLLCRANRAIKPETWERINAALFQEAKANHGVSGDKLRVDSTVCEASIHFPTDASLLWDVYRVGSRLFGQWNKRVLTRHRVPYRFHTRKVKALYSSISRLGRSQTPTAERRRENLYTTLLDRVAEIHGRVLSFLASPSAAASLPKNAVRIVEKFRELEPTMAKIIDQAGRRVLQGEQVPAKEKVLSLFEPHTELIVRGKAGKAMEFGHSVTLGQTGEKFITYYEVLEKRLPDQEYTDRVLAAHKKQFGEYPRCFAGDKGYWKGREHAEAWRENVEVYSVPKKGKRTEEETEAEHSVEFRLMQRFRAGCEGSISVLKRAFGMGKCYWKGFAAYTVRIATSVFCHNLCALFRLQPS
jgi:transposase, IS5 family